VPYFKSVRAQGVLILFISGLPGDGWEGGTPRSGAPRDEGEATIDGVYQRQQDDAQVMFGQYEGHSVLRYCLSLSIFVLLAVDPTVVVGIAHRPCPKWPSPLRQGRWSSLQVQDHQRWRRT
jgi:hypothetical protein